MRRPSPLRVALALGFLAFGSLGLSTACSGTSTTNGPLKEECAGGYINPDTKQCEGKCTPDKCVADNTCVNNRCLLKCTSHLDCYRDGTQNCAPAVEDDTEPPNAFNACQPNSKRYGVGFGCAFGVECDSLGTCASGAACNPTQCGGQSDTCVKDAVACGDKPDCNVGKCPDTTACTVNPCPAAECTSLRCLTKGEGDADAYCTVPSCATDDDCAGGYYCGLTVHPKEGEAKVCLKRSQCAPCKDDLDCSLFASQKCLSIGGETRCARACGTDKDCDPDHMCTDGSCAPRFGSCVGMGGFCEPCANDRDCGPEGSTKVCFEYNGGQKACIDAKPGACKSDAECPLSPGNKLNGLCNSDGICLPPLYQDELECW